MASRLPPPTASVSTTVESIKDYGKTLLNRGTKRQTFWESLSEVDRRGSIDEKISRTIQSRTGWNVDGRVQEYWNEELSWRIERIQNELQDKIFKDFWWDITTNVYMRGASKDDAMPTIVVICWSNGIRRRLCREIKRDNLYIASGFLLLDWKGYIIQKAGSRDSTRKESIPAGLDISGLPVRIKLTSGVEKTASIGGVILVGREYYGLTVAHAFEAGDSLPLDSGAYACIAGKPENPRATETMYREGKSGRDPNDSDASSETESPLHQRPNSEVENADIFVNDNEQSDGDRMIGKFQSFPRCESASGTVVQMPFLNRDLDWALVALDLTSVASMNRFIADGSLVSVRGLEKIQPRRNRVVVVQNGKLCDTECSGTVSITKLPGARRSVRSYSLVGQCDRGDCGSWILEPGTYTALGVITGFQPLLNETCMLNIRDVFDSIWDAWKRPVVIEIPRQAPLDSFESREDFRTDVSVTSSPPRSRSPPTSPSPPRRDDTARPRVIYEHRNHQTNTKVLKELIEPETLKFFDLKWQHGRYPFYVTIMQDLSEGELEHLFEHTKRLRARRETQKLPAIESAKEGGDIRDYIRRAQHGSEDQKVTSSYQIPVSRTRKKR